MAQMMDAYVEIDTIPGEALTAGFEGQIQILDYRHSINQTPGQTHSSAGAQATGRVDIGRITFDKIIDSSTPQLMQATCEGRHISRIKFSFNRAGTVQNTYYTVTLEDALITQVSHNAQGNGADEIVCETIELYFRRIQWEYYQTDQTGGGISGSEVTGWDASTNTII